MSPPEDTNMCVYIHGRRLFTGASDFKGPGHFLHVRISRKVVAGTPHAPGTSIQDFAFVQTPQAMTLTLLCM